MTPALPLSPALINSAPSLKSVPHSALPVEALDPSPPYEPPLPIALAQPSLAKPLATPSVPSFKPASQPATLLSVYSLAVKPYWFYIVVFAGHTLYKASLSPTKNFSASDIQPTSPPTVLTLHSKIYSTLVLDTFLPAEILQQFVVRYHPDPFAIHTDGTEDFALLNSAGKTACVLTLDPNGTIDVDLSKSKAKSLIATDLPIILYY